MPPPMPNAPESKPASSPTPMPPAATFTLPCYDGDRLAGRDFSRALPGGLVTGRPRQ